MSPAKCQCGCMITRHGQCAACEQDAIATKQGMHAGQIREILLAFDKDPRSAHYCDALEASIGALLSSSRNYRHVAETLRQVKPLPQIEST